MSDQAAQWLEAHQEDHVGPAANLNQYWYSASTIATLLAVVREHALTGFQAEEGLACAFVSTPSLYFALSPTERRDCRVFDFDETLGDDVVKFDFNKPKDLPEAMCGTFKCVVIDPPFITAEVWSLYAEAAKVLLAPDGLVVGTTVVENATLLYELLGVRPNAYLPSIPNLPYQYCVYTNFQAQQLNQNNPEVPEHDPQAMLEAARGAQSAGRPAGREEEDRPIRGTGSSAYDFEEMVRRAEEAERRAAGET